jgi:acyl-CoA thioesterase
MTSTGDGVDEFLGLTIERIEPGFARLTLTVSERMLNMYRTCHGGALFAFGDAALGYASNSHGVMAVATGADVNFLAPPRLGDRLAVECREKNRTRRTALYDIEIRNEDTGRLVAAMSGRIAYPEVRKP